MRVVVWTLVSVLDPVCLSWRDRPAPQVEELQSLGGTAPPNNKNLQILFRKIYDHISTEQHKHHFLIHSTWAILIDDKQGRI